MRLVDFSARSLADLDEIARESEAAWGEAQRQRYMLELRRRIDRLPARPELGPPAGLSIRGMRRLRVNHHIVFYLPDEGRITIIRVLHERMDHPGHLR